MGVKDLEQRSCFFMNITVKTYLSTLSYTKPEGHSFIHCIDAEGRSSPQPFIAVALKWDRKGKSVGKNTLFLMFSGFPICSLSTSK